jgi:predicted acylesterase/phospholipase RssA
MPLKIGIALGGGGARNLTHVGILKVLEDENIPISCISGASVGAVVGATYAQNPKAETFIERFKTTLDERFYNQLGLKHLRTNYAQEGSFLHQASRRINRRIVINLAQSRMALLKEIRRLAKRVFNKATMKRNAAGGLFTRLSWYNRLDFLLNILQTVYFILPHMSTQSL